MKTINCSICNKLFKKDEYFWFDDTSEEYFCYDCRKHLNRNHNPMLVKNRENGNLKLIDSTEYAAGPISTKEWNVYDFDEFFSDHTYCPHAKEDLYNHVPVFSQDEKFYCSKCYTYLKEKYGECVVYLGENKIRSLHYGFFPYSNIEFSFSINKIKEDKFNIDVNIKNLKSSDITDLNIYLISLSKDLEVYEDEIEYFLEVPEYLDNLTIFKKFHLNVLNSKGELKKDFIIEIPSNQSIRTFELGLKNNLLTREDLLPDNFYGIKEIKKLVSDLPMDLYIVISFKTNYEVYQSHIEKVNIK